MNKPSRKNAVVDVPADNPDGTMDRFTEGLKRVMSAPKKRGRVRLMAPRKHRKK